MRVLRIAFGLLPFVALLSAARAEDAKPSGGAPALTKPIVVGVLDFVAGNKDLAELAESVPDVVESALGSSKAVRLVSRQHLKKIQEEQKLDLAGLVASGQGAQVGKLVGAQVLVVGRVSMVDDEVLLAAKAIGTETAAFLPAATRGPASGARAKFADELAQKLRAVLEERGAELLAPPSNADAELAALKEKIVALGGALPRVAVRVPERHVHLEKAPDPAAESALLIALTRLGFPLAKVGGSAEAEWLAAAASGKATFPAPASLAADVILAGEGFSEFGGRVGEFVSCRARLEVRAYDRTGKILGTYAGTGSGADLSELFAGKKALDELGRKAALDLALPLAKAGAAPTSPSGNGK